MRMTATFLAILIGSMCFGQSMPARDKQPLSTKTTRANPKDDPRAHESCGQHPTPDCEVPFETTQSILWASDSHLRKVDFPPGSSDAQFGRGYDSVTSTVKEQCVVYNNTPQEIGTYVPGGGQQTVLHFNHATSSESLARALKLDASASFGFGVFSGDLAVSYYRSQQFSRYGEYLVEDVEVVNQTQFLKQPSLTEIAKKAAHEGAVAFQKTCGDQFIVGMVTGGEFSAIYQATVDSESEQEQASATFSASELGNSISASALQTMQRLATDGKMNIQIVRKGTNEALPNFDPVSLQAYIQSFPPKVAPAPQGNPWVLDMTTKEYGSLVNFPGPVNQQQALSHLARYLGKIYQRRAGLQYIDGHRELFGSVDVAKLKQELDNLENTVDDILDRAQKCAQDPHCTPQPVPPIADLPARITWKFINPTDPSRIFVGHVNKGETKDVYVLGFWSPFDHTPPQGVKEWFGPGDSEVVFVRNFDTGQETSFTPAVPKALSQEADVYFQIEDSIYTDNRVYGPDPVRVTLYEPLYPEQQKEGSHSRK